MTLRGPKGIHPYFTFLAENSGVASVVAAFLGGEESAEYYAATDAFRGELFEPVPEDFGLRSVAAYLGRLVSYESYLLASHYEGLSQYARAQAEYRKSYRLWPALDSRIEGGVPLEVRREAVEKGYEGRLITIVTGEEARSAKAYEARGLIDYEGRQELKEVRLGVDAGENVENERHVCKTCANVKGRLRGTDAMKKVEGAARRALEGWRAEVPSLFSVTFESLTVRCAELWRYEIGGGLVDPYHYDTDSVLTVVVLLEKAEEGGDFRTYDSSTDEHTVHDLEVGGCVAFLSRKYHNITPVVAGGRESLVVEFWEGGNMQVGR